MAYVAASPRKTSIVRRQRLSMLDLISVYRQRRDLARLDDRALKDIGISREQADREARRPFWDLPTI